MSLDRILGGTEEEFDTKMLLDPFEKQLDLPPASPLEVDISSVHDVESIGFGQQQVQNVDVVQVASADVQERGNVAAQI